MLPKERQIEHEFEVIDINTKNIRYRGFLIFIKIKKPLLTYIGNLTGGGKEKGEIQNLKWEVYNLDLPHGFDLRTTIETEDTVAVSSVVKVKKSSIC